MRDNYGNLIAQTAHEPDPKARAFNSGRKAVEQQTKWAQKADGIPIYEFYDLRDFNASMSSALMGSFLDGVEVMGGDPPLRSFSRDINNKKTIMTFEKILQDLKKNEPLVISDFKFFQESIFDKVLHSSRLITLNFLNSTFTDVDFMASYIVSCTFKNCKFENVIFQRCEFLGSTFSNCTFENCNLTRTSFEGGKFRDCNFINTNLWASDFQEFDFIETRFKDSNLEFASVGFSKIWTLNECIKIKKFSNLEKFFKNISSND